MAFKEKLSAYQDRIEAGIDRHVPAAATRPRRLHAAMRYSMEAGGKRIRPVLVLAAAEAAGAELDPVPAAVAIECLHTYSLIHDDLPSVDNSALRRGRPACHVQFDEATALLAGDALLTFAFELLAQAYGECPEVANALVLDLATTAGSRRLIGGQMEDIDNEGQQPDADTLAFIHSNKTAALLSTAVTMGFRLAHPARTGLGSAQAAGLHLGLAFQIIDDILDATSDSETMGKPVGNDAELEKCTYVALHGLEGAKAEALRHSEQAIEHFRQIEGDTSFLLALTRELSERIN